MRINLLCTYEERHAVKALGARWDAALKVWYVIDPPDLLRLAKWLPLDAQKFLATGGGEDLCQAPPTPREKPTPRTKRKASPRELPPLALKPFKLPVLETGEYDPSKPPW